ncbi:MAG: hypothetical protein GY864_13840 [Desulfobacterales bacterium]|nr:hypothetical protein [Desulfobacterales bacterium]
MDGLRGYPCLAGAGGSAYQNVIILNQIQGFKLKLIRCEGIGPGYPDSLEDRP